MDIGDASLCRVIYGKLDLRIMNWREKFLRMYQKLLRSGML